MSAPKLLLLPREPTPAMVEAAQRLDNICPINIWRAMVAVYQSSASPALLEGGRSTTEVALDIAAKALREIAARETAWPFERAAHFAFPRAREALAKIAALTRGSR
jgi:hypothetical protein